MRERECGVKARVREGQRKRCCSFVNYVRNWCVFSSDTFDYRVLHSPISLSLSLSLSSWTPIGASLMPEGVCVCAIACNGPPALKTKARSAVHVGSKNVKNLLNVLL